MTEVAQEFGKNKYGFDRVQPFHMHGDEFLMLFHYFDEKDIDAFFSRVSGQISTK